MGTPLSRKPTYTQEAKKRAHEPMVVLNFVRGKVGLPHAHTHTFFSIQGHEDELSALLKTNLRALSPSTISLSHAVTLTTTVGGEKARDRANGRPELCAGEGGSPPKPPPHGDG